MCEIVKTKLRKYVHKSKRNESKSNPKTKQSTETRRRSLVPYNSSRTGLGIPNFFASIAATSSEEEDFSSGSMMVSKGSTKKTSERRPMVSMTDMAKKKPFL